MYFGVGLHAESGHLPRTNPVPILRPFDHPDQSKGIADTFVRYACCRVLAIIAGVFDFVEYAQQRDEMS